MTVDDANGATAASVEADNRSGRRTAVAGAAAWAFVFLVLRIFAVSGYDWNTAFAVSTTLGLDDGLSLVFGSLMSGHLLVSVLLVCVLPLLLSAYLWSPHGHRPVVVLAATLGLVVLVALTVSFHSWWLPVTVVALLGMAALIRRLPASHRLSRGAMVVMMNAVRVAAVGVLLVAAFIQTPWVPLERIETTNGVIAGYVLSVDSGYLNVLTDKQQFVILISGDVLSRR